METIKSFLINHDAHPEGVYLSHTEHNIYTYDLRFKKPNAGDFLTTAAAHTVEHLFATVIRNSAVKDKVLNGMRRGSRKEIARVRFFETKVVSIDIVKECFEKCLEMTEIPGSKRQECGNYLDHDLEGAKEEIRAFLPHII